MAFPGLGRGGRARHSRGQGRWLSHARLPAWSAGTFELTVDGVGGSALHKVGMEGGGDRVGGVEEARLQEPSFKSGGSANK